MDNATLKTILANHASNTELLEEIEIPAVIIPDNTGIESLEHLMLAPMSYKVNFDTRHLHEFIGYSNKHKTNSIQVYIETRQMSAKTYFDLGTPNNPGWGRHVAQLQLSKTPAFEALSRLNDTKLSQQEIIDFCTDWEPNIIFFDAEHNLIDFPSAINRLRLLTVESAQKTQAEQGNFSSNRSAMESIEIKAGTEPMPAYFKFTSQPYDDFKMREINCEIRALSGDNKVSLKYRISALSALIENIGDEFKEKINDELKDADIYMGTLQNRNR